MYYLERMGVSSLRILAMLANWPRTYRLILLKKWRDKPRRSTVVGTPYWMVWEMSLIIQFIVQAPEVRRGIEYGTEVDIYSFGNRHFFFLQCNLFRNCSYWTCWWGTSRCPHTANQIDSIGMDLNPMRMLYLHNTADFNQPKFKSEKWTEEMRDLLSKCTEQEATKRPTAEMLLQVILMINFLINQHPFISKSSIEQFIQVLRHVEDQRINILEWQHIFPRPGNMNINEYHSIRVLLEISLRVHK